MGVVNVTPDSFSDGGQWFEPSAAIEHGRELLAQGADILDVGGESTRPGAERPSVAEELRRVLPVVAALAAEGAVVSVDTMRAEVAAEALAVGAGIVNDVSGGLADPAMAGLVAAAGVPFVAMHWRGHSVDMQSRAVYDDVVADVVRRAVAAGARAGGGRDRGRPDRARPRLRVRQADGPQLVAAARARPGARARPPGPGRAPPARPSSAGSVCRPAVSRAPPLDRDAATAATSMHAARLGAWGVRVHHIPSTLDAMRVARAIQDAQ